jgi:hypothetical protein
VKTIVLAAALGIVVISQLRPADPPQPQAIPSSLLETNTLFTVYGRGFDRAPILGHLGAYKNIDAMATDTKTWIPKITAANGGKGVVVGIHLIYGLATPCKDAKNCLEYFDQGNHDLVAEYIKPAAAHGWTVVLDTQLGESDPVSDVKRMIDKGYLKYDNVHVAIDPEFHVVPGHDPPGIPIGTITAAQVNEVQEILDHYVQTEHLKTKKILMVHQFGDAAVHDGVPFMIADKKNLKGFANVDLVIDADGLGNPAEKVRKYNLMTDSKTYPVVRFGGIKVFFPNQWEHAGHFDKPPMTVDQIFGLAPVVGTLRMATKPSVLIIA